MELRVSFYRCTAFTGRSVRALGSKRLPLRLRHEKVEGGQNHRSVRHSGDHAEQATNGRSREVDASSADEAGRWLLAPTASETAQQQVAASRQIDGSARLKNDRPLVQHEAELVERALPMDRQVRKISGEIAKPRRLHFLDLELIERSSKLGRQAERFRGIGTPLLLDQTGEHHQALRRLDCRRNGSFEVDRVEGPAEPLVEVRIADWNQSRQEQSAAGAANEGILNGAGGALVRDENDASSQGDRILVIERQETRCEGVGKSPVRRDREDIGIHRVKLEEGRKKSSAQTLLKIPSAIRIF